MKFSVVIAAYAASKTIARTLRSLLAQSLQPFEVIIVDDASQDSNQLFAQIQIFRRHGLKIRYQRHTQNRNGAVARNTGIHLACGDYIAFMDADDEWAPSKLKVYGEYIKRIGPKTLYFSQVRMVRDGTPSGVRPEVAPSPDQHISEYLFLSGGFIQTSTIVLATEYAKQVLFDERFVRHQDYDFCLRAYSLGLDFRFIPLPLTQYHIEGKLFKSKNESYRFCYWWSDQMRPYMSEQGYQAYRFFLISGRLYCERQFSRLLANACSAAARLGVTGLWKARGKIRFIVRSFL